MARYFFTPSPPQARYSTVRFDTASGSATPAAQLSTVDGSRDFPGAVISRSNVDSSDNFPIVLGPDGVSTLYEKTLDIGGGIVGAPVALTGYLGNAATVGPTPAITPPRLAPKMRPQMVVTAQTGHGFGIYGNNAGATNLNDTTDYLLGTQSIKITTAGAGAFSAMSNAALTAFDATGKDPVVFIKVDDAATMQNASIHFYLGSGGSSANRYDWQLLGPNVVNQNLSNGNWVAITLPFAGAFITGTPNRAALNYAAVTVQDPNTGTGLQYRFNGFGLIPEQATAYPNGVVVFTLDDTMDGQATIAQPILSTAGFQATLFPITGVVGQAGKLTLAQMRTMQDNLGWEVGTHASTQANHDIGWNNMTDAQLATEIVTVQTWLAQNGFRGSDIGAYPLATYTNATINVISRYLACARGVQPYPRETTPFAEPYRLRCMTNIGGAGGTAVATLTAANGPLDQCVSDKGVLILCFHQFIASGTTLLNQTTQADFQTLVTSVQSKGLAVRTLGDVMLVR